MAATATAELPRIDGGSLNNSATKHDSPGQFDRLLQEQDEEMDEFKNKDQIALIMASEAFKLNERSLECPGLENNPLFTNLRSRLL